ncbi:MAG: DUF3179 domain-containing protein [Desulfobulbaceae bacterium]|nr:MAG: DUF3179 domain-containing protein [Desulfobulbaceae bacterium]
MVDLAAVYSRTLDGKTLTLAPSGWTYKNTFVLYDKKTMSLWYPERNGLRAITGPYLGKFLPEMKSSDTRWDRWLKMNPESKMLR